MMDHGVGANRTISTNCTLSQHLRRKTAGVVSTTSWVVNQTESNRIESNQISTKQYGELGIIKEIKVLRKMIFSIVNRTISFNNRRNRKPTIIPIQYLLLELFIVLKYISFV